MTILLAVLLGAVIPLLFQMRATLRAAERALHETPPRVDATLVEVARLVASTSEVVESVRSTSRVLSAIGAAVGPAIVAGIRSYREAHTQLDSPEEEDHEPRDGVEGRA